MAIYRCIPLVYAEDVVRRLFCNSGTAFAKPYCVYDRNEMDIIDQNTAGGVESWVVHSDFCGREEALFQYDCNAGGFYSLLPLRDVGYSVHEAIKLAEEFENCGVLCWLPLDESPDDWEGDVGYAYTGFITNDGSIILPSSLSPRESEDCESEREYFYLRLIPNSYDREILCEIFNRHHRDNGVTLDFRPGKPPVIVGQPSHESENSTQTPEPQAPDPQPAPQPETEPSKPKKPSKNTTKGSNVMKGFDFMHQLDDERIASTMLGIAVKVGDSWRIYDKAKKEITDLGDVQLGNFPLWVIPALKLAPGDIIIDGDKYYCVTSKNDRIQTVDIATGKTHSIVPVKNILGFSVYQKVMAITDALGIDTGTDGGLTDDKNLMMMAMMAGSFQGGESAGGAMGMQGLLPLLLLRGEVGDMGNDDLLFFAMMGMNGTRDQQGDLVQLLLLRRLLHGDKSPIIAP